MTPEERQLLVDLFERVKSAAGTPRDREAETFISDRVREQPYAPYLFAQTVIVQEEALKAAASRIQELEGQLAEARQAAQAGSTSFLGGLGKSLFGGDDRADQGRSASGIPSVRPGVQPMEAQPQARSPWGAPPPPAPAPGGYAAPGGFGQGGFGGGGFGAPQGGGGGFLRSAMTTAAGVAGGALLFQGISNLFSSHHGANTMFAGQSLTDQLAGGTDPSSIGKDIFTQPSEAGAQPASFSDNLGPNSDPGFGDQGYGDQGFVDDATFQDDGELDGGNDGGDWT